MRPTAPLGAAIVAGLLVGSVRGQEPLVLGPVLVEGEAEAASTQTIGEPPPAYAGGQVARGGRFGVLGNRDYMDTPFSTQSFTSELIKDRQVSGVTELIELDPAVSLANTGDFTNTGYLRIRGFPDYTSLNNASLDGLVGLLSADPPVEFLERVDLIKGANAFLSGAFGSVGGSLSYTLKRAPDTPLFDTTGTYASDSVVGGHLDLGRRFGRENAFGIRANLFGRNGDTAVREGQRRDDGQSLALDYRGERLRLEAAYLRDNRRSYGYSFDVTVAEGVKLPGAPNNDVFTQPNWMTYESSQDLALGRAEYDLTENWTLAAGVGRSEARSFYNGYCRAILLDVDGTTQCDAFFGDTRYETLAGDVTLRGDIATGPLRHQLVVGANGFDVQERAKPYGISSGSFTYDLFDSSRPGRPSLETGGNISRTNERRTTGLFAADTVSVLDGRLSLTAGVRNARIETDSFDQETDEETASYDETEPTPFVGMLARITPEVSVYASYIEALQQGGVAPVTARNAGQAFPAIESTQYEAGLKLDLGDIGATLAVFRIKKPNEFTDASTNIFSQDGEQVNRGVELNVFGEPMDGVRVLAGGAYIDAELESTADGEFDGNTAPAVPRWEGRLIGEWDVPWIAGLTLNADLIYSGNAELDNANSQTIPDWAELDEGARYAFEAYGRPPMARLNVENVTDHDHWVAGSGSGLLEVSRPRRLLVSPTAAF